MTEKFYIIYCMYLDTKKVTNTCFIFNSQYGAFLCEILSSKRNSCRVLGISRYDSDEQPDDILSEIPFAVSLMRKVGFCVL